MGTPPETHLLERYRRLIEITSDLSSTLDLDQLLERIILAAADITGAESASILLYDDAARQLFFQVSSNIDDAMMRGLAVPLEGSIAGWIVLNRQPVRIDNVQNDQRYFNRVAQTTSLETRSLMGVPLITKDKVIGVLEVINKRTGYFSQQDEDLLAVLGSQAAVAIENSRLFQQSDLIAEFVHELRTPLASLSTATYLLLRPQISHEQSDQILHTLYTETLRLSEMASSFLDLARLESGRVQYHKSQFDVKELFEESRDLMQGKAAEYNVNLSIDVPHDLPQLEADRDKIKQVLLNLLSNGIKYNHPGGTVTLSGSLEDKYLVICVRDSGMGIPEDDLQHLFEKFYRVKQNETKAVGTGLGLSICKQIVQGHNGSIAVQSKIGEGTTFTVKLPQK
jgi:signal transduction histidine kinase